MNRRELRRWRIGMTTVLILVLTGLGLIAVWLIARVGPVPVLGLTALSMLASLIYGPARELWLAKPTGSKHNNHNEAGS